MKIQVVRQDGDIETLDLLGAGIATDPSPGGQGCLKIGKTSHFFNEDGTYDGWGMDVAEAEGNLNENDLLDFISVVKRTRVIHHPKQTAPTTTGEAV